MKLMLTGVVRNEVKSHLKLNYTSKNNKKNNNDEPVVCNLIKIFFLIVCVYLHLNK